MGSGTGGGEGGSGTGGGGFWHRGRGGYIPKYGQTHT